MNTLFKYLDKTLSVDTHRLKPWVSTEYEELTSHKPSFKDFLLSCPKLEQEFEFERNESDYSAAQVPIMNPWSKQGDPRSED